jgi:hypothetical protein
MAIRYIFDQQIDNFINKSEANYSLAMSSLTYLCSGIFDAYLSDRRVQDNILSGRYRLHWFATSQWITLIRRCVDECNDLSAYPALLALLTRLALELTNYRFKYQIGLKDEAFRAIESDWPEISQIIRGVLQFRQDERQTDWNYTNGLFAQL